MSITTEKKHGRPPGAWRVDVGSKSNRLRGRATALEAAKGTRVPRSLGPCSWCGIGVRGVEHDPHRSLLLALTIIGKAT